MLLRCRTCRKRFMWSRKDQVEALKDLTVEKAVAAGEKEILKAPKECPECRKKEKKRGR